MTFWKIATSVLIALTWSLPAFATHENRRSERRQERDDVRIERLAHELEESARFVDHRVRDSRHFYSRSDRRAIRAVHQLKNEAKHFNKVVESNRRSPSHLARDLDRVERAYQTAVYRVARTHDYGHVARELRRVGAWIDRINDRCDGSRQNVIYKHDARPARHDRADRYDGHDRFGRNYDRNYDKQRSNLRGSQPVSWKSPQKRYNH